jgi:hypothetical protein
VKTVDNKLLVRAFLHIVDVNVQNKVHSSEVLTYWLRIQLLIA